MASQRFQLGTYFGIRLYVHWTFLLLVAYVTYAAWASGAPPAMIGFTVIQLLAVFLCVTLHEYGHALAAKRYQVDTHDITLLPIGGVARLKRIPRIPMQEFVIAVAGPAVNVVIACLLLVAILVSGGGWVFTSIFDASVGLLPTAARGEIETRVMEVFETPNLLGFAISLMMINTILVVFNMIPAFPMDGGRVLRSFLAFALPYAEATRWAQRIGLVCAILMGLVALSSDPPRIVMLLISGFILFAGYAEVRQVEIYDMVNGLRVGHVMTQPAPAIPADLPMPAVMRWWQTHSGNAAAVVGVSGVYLGVIRLQDVIRHLQGTPSATNSKRGTSRGGDPQGTRWQSPWEATAIDLANVEADTLGPHDGLEHVLANAKQSQRQFPVTDYSGSLIGWLDVDSINQRCTLARLTPPAVSVIPPTSGGTFSQLDQHA